MGRLTLRRLGATLVVAALLAGCGPAGDDDGAADPRPATESPTDPTTEPTTEPPADLTVRPAPPAGAEAGAVPAGTLTPSAGLHVHPTTCAGGGTRVEAVNLDAALGHRYLAVQLVNCSERALTLRGLPDVVLRTSLGRSAHAVVRPWADRSPVRVRPGGRAYLGLEYLVADQQPAVTALTLRVAGDDHVVTGDLDLDARTRISGYPWVSRVSALWGS